MLLICVCACNSILFIFSLSHLFFISNGQNSSTNKTFSFVKSSNFIFPFKIISLPTFIKSFISLLISSCLIKNFAVIEFFLSVISKLNKVLLFFKTNLSQKKIFPPTIIFSSTSKFLFSSKISCFNKSQFNFKHDFLLKLVFTPLFFFLSSQTSTFFFAISISFINLFLISFCFSDK